MIWIVLGCFGAATIINRFVPSLRTQSRWCDRWVLHVALPALILAKIPNTAFDATLVIPVSVAWGYLIAAALIIVWLGRKMSWSRRVVGTLLLVTPLGNTSFLGLAVVEVALSRDHLPTALIFDQFGSFLALATYGSVVASIYGSGGERGVRHVLRRLFRFTPFVALLMAFALRTFEVPGSLHDVFAAIGRTVAPVAMVSLGLRFQFAWPGAERGPVVIPVMLRLVALPAVVFVVATVVGDPSSTAWQTTILESAMPPMVTAGVVAANSDLDADLAASVVGMGTIMSLGTLTLWGLILR